MALRSALINAMTNSARKAARGLLRDFNEVEHLQISRKGPADFVSAADRKAEKVLQAELSKLRPDFGFIMEEGGRIEAKDGKHYWVIDPLDGTDRKSVV
jgi:myo-inositol-1(or 4)-monophosphatase